MKSDNRKERDHILDVDHLSMHFTTKKRGKTSVVKAVDDVSFVIHKGETLGIVGESGCGKTVTIQTVIGLNPKKNGSIKGGEVLFNGQNLLDLTPQQMRKLQGNQLSIIFQDPFSSLNPRKTVSETIAEPLKLNGIITDKGKRMERVAEIMEIVGLAERLYNAYPHELDGGRRQRIGIARALAVEPEFVICDEPISALDVSIQAQVLNMLKELQEEMGLTYLFIAHDLSVVKYISDRVIVMYLGTMVEFADSEELYAHPLHPYTQVLLSSIPVADPRLVREKKRIMVKGEIPSPINPKDCCRFAERCPYATEECRAKLPELREVTPGHFVACHMVK